MKKLILLCVVVCLSLMGCNKSSPTSPDPPAPKANVIMHEGPLWRVSASGNLAYHYGIVKNIGNRTADYTKVYIYLYKSDGGLLLFEYTYADKTEIQPNDTSPWEVLWWYPDIKDQFDPSKTKYEIEWSEY